MGREGRFGITWNQCLLLEGDHLRKRFKEKLPTSGKGRDDGKERQRRRVRTPQKIERSEGKKENGLIQEGGGINNKKGVY